MSLQFLLELLFRKKSKSIQKHMISVFIKFRLPWLKSVQRGLFVICIWLIFIYVVNGCPIGLKKIKNVSSRSPILLKAYYIIKLQNLSQIREFLLQIWAIYEIRKGLAERLFDNSFSPAAVSTDSKTIFSLDTVLQDVQFAVILSTANLREGIFFRNLNDL